MCERELIPRHLVLEVRGPAPVIWGRGKNLQAFRGLPDGTILQFICARQLFYLQEMALTMNYNWGRLSNAGVFLGRHALAAAILLLL